MLDLTYITNKKNIALIAEKNGVNRIFIDMEFIGKEKRQGNIDSVKNFHTAEDVRKIKSCLNSAKVLTRINPIHEKTDGYYDTEDEIEAVIKAGTDIIMLPYFKTVFEVKRFLDAVNNRARTVLLLETKEAVLNLDAILKLKGIDEIFIGLNDLSISYNEGFMFDMLLNGVLEDIVKRIKEYDIPFGFGGIAAVHKGDVPAELIIKEHYRLGSSAVILSRSFFDQDKASEEEAKKVFSEGVREIRALEMECESHIKYFSDNEILLRERIKDVIRKREPS